MDHLHTFEAAQEFQDLHNDLRLAKRDLFYRALGNCDQPHGSVYPPHELGYWQKECGEFEVFGGEALSRELNNDHYDIDQTDFAFTWRDKTGQRHSPIPSEENLLYVGKWCKLYNHTQAHKHFSSYAEAINKLSGTKFEKLLKGDGSYQRISAGYRHMLTYLKEQKVTVRPYEGFPFTEELPETRELELAVFRLIAGALEVYLNPNHFIDDAPVNPHKDIRKATQVALNKINYHNFEIQDDLREQLEALAGGQNPGPYHSTIVADSSRRKILVREVSLLSKKLLNTTSPKKNRFPTSALKALLSMVEENPPTRRTLGGYQCTYDEVREDDPNEQPHTDNHSVWLKDIWNYRQDF
jgi:hypothetical protein